jgi:trimethylamine--corrinoid protein Co-methyltransferase
LKNFQIRSRYFYRTEFRVYIPVTRREFGSCFIFHGLIGLELSLTLFTILLIIHPVAHQLLMKSARKRKNRRRRDSVESTARIVPHNPARSGIEGGQYRPLGESDKVQIDLAVREILQHVGLSDAPAMVIERVIAAGGCLTEGDRLTFPGELIEQALEGLSKKFTLHGQTPGHELRLTGKRVHLGSGGAAPRILDLENGVYRNSTLRDLYNAARLVDYLGNIHFFSRSLVAGDMPDLHSLDINTAYACLSGTAKHVCTSASLPEHVAEIADMCFTISGSAEAFAEKPFLSLNINHVVAPLRFDNTSCAVMSEAARLGIPIHANTFGQLGASSPVTIAGSVAQTVAETLAGMVFAWLVNPRSKVIFGTRPMVTDLRTGGMTGGSGEQAVLMAATAQMAQYYDLPNSTIAGATDSKIGDAQSGYEKCLTVLLAAQAGSNLITQSCGMQASLMGCALESYVIDNDMLGSIMRSLAPIEVNELSLAVSVINDVVHGEGHFLGQPETLSRMQTDFLYPEIGDRRTIEEWERSGSRNIREVAIQRTREILDNYFPAHISHETDKTLRSKFDIRLTRESRN